MSVIAEGEHTWVTQPLSSLEFKQKRCTTRRQCSILQAATSYQSNIIAENKLVVTELLHAASTETDANTHHGLISLCFCLVN